MWLSNLQSGMKTTSLSHIFLALLLGASMLVAQNGPGKERESNWDRMDVARKRYRMLDRNGDRKFGPGDFREARPDQPIGSQPR